MSIGYLQELYAISSTAKHIVGTLRIEPDGTKWRYAKAGEALTSGYATVAPQAAAAHVDESMAAAASVGDTILDLTVTAGTAIAAGDLSGGRFHVCDAGASYRIVSNTAISSGGTAITVALERPIMTALTTSSEFSLIKSPWMDITMSATDENFCTGVCQRAVTDDYYFWVQTGGEATALILNTPAVGSNLIYSPSGALAVIATSVDVDVPIVGYMYGSAGVNGDFGNVFLKID